MWYVIQTMSGDERKSLEDCQRKLDAGFYHSMFIPEYISKKHYLKEWHDVKKPLFPGYFFIDAEPDRIDDIFLALKAVNRLTKFLRDADEISPITEQEQEFLQSMMDEEHVVRYSRGFMIGENVYITEGPLRNQVGRIRHVNRHRRIAMLDVNIFGRQTPVEVGFSAFARVTEEEFEERRQRNIAKYSRKAGSSGKDYGAGDGGSPHFQKDRRHHSRHSGSEERKAPVISKDGLVTVCSGIFEGMTGRFLAADPVRGEWTLEMEVFDTPTRVVFRTEELSTGTA